MASQNSYIYIGRWTDWSRGAVNGQMLTISQRDGGFLVAFLAIYVATAGTSFWRLMSYTVHQILASKSSGAQKDEDRLVLLRNNATAATALWEFTHLGWSSRRRHSFCKYLGLIALALLNIILFGLAAIFTSNVSKAVGNTVLVRSDNCGYSLLNQGRLERASVEDYWRKMLTDSIQAAEYARDCYGPKPNDLQCTTFKNPQIPFTKTLTDTCPFNQTVCWPDTPTVQFDTELIDPQLDLGMNSPPSERLSVRWRSTCSVLDLDDFLYYDNVPDNGTKNQADHEDLVYRMWAGPASSYNYTYEYNFHKRYTTYQYNVEPFGATAGQVGWWDPIAELNRTDADVSLFFLMSNSVWYQAPTDDPVFKTQNESVIVEILDEDKERWFSNLIIGVMGCAEQYQICGQAGCTDLTGLRVMNQSESLFSGSSQTSARFRRLTNSLFSINMYDAVAGRSGSALKASQTLSDGIQLAELPADWWQTELTEWFSVALARLQFTVREYAAGPENTEYVVPPSNKAEREMCKNQLVRDDGKHQNFSILGIAVVIVGGGIIILLGVTIDTLVGWTQRLIGKGGYRRRQWKADSVLELQKARRNSTLDDQVVPLQPSRPTMYHHPSSQFSGRSQFSRMSQHSERSESDPFLAPLHLVQSPPMQSPPTQFPPMQSPPLRSPPTQFPPVQSPPMHSPPSYFKYPPRY